MEVKYLDLKRITETFEPELKRAMADVVASGWFLQGEQTKAFEAEFAAFCGSAYCLGVANGLDALTLILKSYKLLLGWAEGDEVIVPAFTFIATAEAVTRAGLTPVFCDVHETDYLINETLLPNLLSSKTRAVMPVHLFGRVCAMETICMWAHEHNIKVIEDAAQAHGARTTDGRRAGSMADAAAFSFYPGKNLGALGDGGAVVTNDDSVIRMSRMLANYGMSQKYVHDYLGLNSRLDELQAAVLRVKLKRLDFDNARRQAIAKRYDTEIQNSNFDLPYHNAQTEPQSIYHIYPLMCKAPRESVQRYLNNKGVQTQIHYPIAPHQQRAYQTYNQLNFPVAQLLAERELSLPLHQALKEEEVTFIISLLNDFVC